MSKNTTWIAQRELYPRGSDDKVIVHLGQPRFDGQDYECALVVESFSGYKAERTVRGVDSVQSILLAIDTIAIVLKTAEEQHFKKRLCWLDDGETPAERRWGLFLPSQE